MKFSTTALLLIVLPAGVWGFSSPIFESTKTVMAPTKTQGVEIELPDFDELFGRIQSVSPLAKIAIEQTKRVAEEGASHFDSIEEDESLKWTTLESKPNALITQVDKIDNFQNLNCPILRLRGKIKGPCHGTAFANFTMHLDERKKWDPAIQTVYEAYPIQDLDVANVLMGFGKYGDCSRLGVGYCRTKSYLAVSGREQLTLCGIQNFQDGSCVIWGTEMEEWHNHLLPHDQGDRTTRSKSHLFSTTLVPTGPDSFDVEYALQIDVGGKLPNWVTTPILVETIKGLFRHGSQHFDKEQDNLRADLERMDHQMEERNSILMTP